MVAACVGACGGDDSGAPAATTATSAPPAAAITATVDWQARTVTVTGETEFDVAFCEGDAPLLCVSSDGEQLGVVEQLSFEAVSLDTFAPDFYEATEADRVAGCDPRYSLEGEEAEPARMGELRGIRYGFTGTIEEEVVERVVGYAASDQGRTFIIVANAIAGDICLARETELPVDVMGDFEPLLEALATGSSGMA